MAGSVGASRDEVSLRVVILFVPIVLTARLLSLWIPKPLAWTVSMVAWMLAIYWLPTRTDFCLKRWLIIVSVSGILALILAILQPDWF